MANKLGKKEAPTRKVYKNPKVQDLMRMEIFRAAARAAEKKNFDVISMDDVARELGGSKGTIYYYFKSKDALIGAMVIHVYSSIETALMPIFLDKSLSASEKLAKVSKQEIILLLNDWSMQRALWTNTWWAALNKKDFQRVMKMRKIHRKTMADLISEITRGKNEKPQMLKHKARLVMGLIESIVGWYRPDGSYTPEELADSAVEMIFHGLQNS